MEENMIHLYAGDGKGKTTAAIGLAVRAAGNGENVVFAQFMKGNESGEIHALKQLRGVVVLRPEVKYPFYKMMTEKDKQEITKEHNRILDKIIEIMNEKRVKVLVLDEVTYAVNWGLVSSEKLNRILLEKKAEIVLTGQNPDEKLKEKADYFTEMKKIKHPFDQGVKARKSVEF